MFLDFFEISKLRNTEGHPCEPKISQYDEVLVSDIFSNISCKPYYIQDNFKQFDSCSDVNDVVKLNGFLDIENTFSKFKGFHKKPCANLALTYQQKTKDMEGYYVNKTVNGVTKKFYKLKLEYWITFLMDEIKLVTQIQAYPLWSFGAELGGYIGMFLGISLMQVPYLLNICLEFSSAAFHKSKKVLR